MISFGVQPSRLAVSATVFCAAAWPAGPVAQFALPAFTIDGTHAAFRGAQMFLGNGDRSGDHKILREDRGGGSRNVARNNGEIERAGFFQSAGEACEAKSARKRSFGECVLHQRDIRVTSAPPPEATSSPPRWRLGCSAELRLACSWRGSYFGGFFVETFFQIGNGFADGIRRGAAGNFFCGERGVDVQPIGKIGFKCRGDFLQIFERQVQSRLFPGARLRAGLCRRCRALGETERLCGPGSPRLRWPAGAGLEAAARSRSSRNSVPASAPTATRSMSRLDRARRRELLCLPASRADSSWAGLSAS